MAGEAMLARFDDEPETRAVGDRERFPEEWLLVLTNSHRAAEGNLRDLEPWEQADLALLPEASRYEGDALLFMSTPADPLAHAVTRNLRRVLDARTLGSDLAAVRQVGIRMGSSVLEPAVSLIRRPDIDWHANAQPASAAVLVVDVIAPSTRGADHALDAERCARAGIRGYWRIEVEPVITVSAYALQDGEYVEVGTWAEGEIVTVTEPVSMRFDPASLRP